MDLQKDLSEFYNRVRELIASGRQSAYRAVNAAMVQTYWEIGRLIVEEEQQGKARADYGDYLIRELSKRLQDDFGKGFAEQSLRNYRLFYLAFPIRSALRSELTWTHYRLLMRIDNETTRQFYEDEASKSVWSTRALERQINAHYYERLLASRDQAGVEQEALKQIEPLAATPRDFVRDPYVLEFLDVSAHHSLYERDLEQLLIDNLQQFLLELGRGFSFVARQQRINAEGEDFFIDLVFYNFILKCFVLIDLKIGKLTHQDIGQMDMYVRMYNDKFKIEGDNPTIGIILCSEKNEAVVKYSILSDSQQIFASKYLLYLPSEAELKAELQRERLIAETQIEKLEQGE
jgi:predicted nuclease of restriction endonuclease-like (RecB) superfamily